MTAVPDTTGLNTLYGRNTRLGRGPARTVVSMAALTALAGVLFVAGQTVFRDWEALAVGEAARAVGFTYSWSRFSTIFVGFFIAFFLRHYGTLGVFTFIAGAMVTVFLIIAIMGPRTTGLRLEAISR